MRYKDLKYLLAYLGPLAAFLSILYSGYFAFAVPFLEFFLIPLIELFVPASTTNISKEEEAKVIKQKYFDALLYLNLPMVYALLFLYFSGLHNGIWSPMEIIGITIGMGVLIATSGINVAHELGHRKQPFELFFAKALLLPAFYLHFTIEHNRGHHIRVGTPADPATARKNESIYTFFVRSVIGSYLHAWTIENDRLKDLGQNPLTFRNQMVRFHVFELLYAFVISFYFGWNVLLFAILVGVTGFLLLESVNYIEHYGLMRKQLPSGRYEPVQKKHSWNSNHELGRIFLYELTRHADHHYKTSRKYQVLRHFDESPQLPTGYPGSIILAFFPFLWFRVMNPRVEAWSG